MYEFLDVLVVEGHRVAAEKFLSLDVTDLSEKADVIAENKSSNERNYLKRKLSLVAKVDDEFAAFLRERRNRKYYLLDA